MGYFEIFEKTHVVVSSAEKTFCVHGYNVYGHIGRLQKAIDYVCGGSEQHSQYIGQVWHWRVAFAIVLFHHPLIFVGLFVITNASPRKLRKLMTKKSFKVNEMLTHR